MRKKVSSPVYLEIDMGWFDYFHSSSHHKTAAVAKERLQIIVAHERHQRSGNPSALDYLPLLQKELLQVVRKYVVVEDEHIKVQIEKEGNYEVLEVNITLPEVENRSAKEKGKK
jgi:cell division topological specificity factor